MINEKDKSLKPSKEFCFFYYDPEGDGFCYFKSEAVRDEHANGAIMDYLQYGWSEDVVNVISGRITGCAAMTDVVIRPETVDDEGVAGDGEYWGPDASYKCNYSIKPLGFTCPSACKIKG